MTTLWQIFLIAGDYIALTASLAITYALRFKITKEQISFSDLSSPFSIIFVIWIVIFFVFNLYNAESINPNPRNIGRLTIAMITGGIIGIIFFYAFPKFGLAPKASLIFISIFGFVILVIWRRLFNRINSSVFTRPTLIIGSENHAKKFSDDIKGHPHIKDIEIISTNENLSKKIKDYIKQYGRCLIVVGNHALAKEIFPLTAEHGVDIMTMRSAYEEFLGKIPIRLITDEYAIELATQNDRNIYEVSRFIVDKIVALVILIIVSPFVLLAMLAILIESGSPVFYTQKRVGKNGKVFDFYKLRSMVKDAEKSGAQWATNNDSRITFIGKIIRKTHIDELPQMWNVLKGDISLVGPRPERPEFVDKLSAEIPYYDLRHSTKPGFTGWAQIKFRYARTVEDSGEKFEYDLYYIKNKNPLLDFGIILKTIQIIITH